MPGHSLLTPDDLSSPGHCPVSSVVSLGHTDSATIARECQHTLMFLGVLENGGGRVSLR
jgi:hypothetical protein